MEGSADTAEVMNLSRLRVFFGIDIDQSTPFKQSDRAFNPEQIADWWVYTFLSFYREVVDDVERQWAVMSAAVRGLHPTDSHQLGDPPLFWKGAGDEVLFTKVVVSPQDALLTVNVAIAVMQKYRQSLKKSDHTRDLDVKGAAWIAGFPINNLEIADAATTQPGPAAGDPVARNLRLLMNGVLPVDFIGPSIDLGFRLREHASKQRFIVSADLAWLLACADDKISKEHRNKCSYLQLPSWGFSGSQTLQGVLSGKPYPIVWIRADRDEDHDELARAEQSLSGVVTTGVVRDYCSKYLDSSSPCRSVPYVPGCDDSELAKVPDNHRERLKRLAELVSGAMEQFADIEKPDSQLGNIPTTSETFGKEVVADLSEPVPTNVPRPTDPS